jgi:ankyrin repeat protein
MRSAIFRTRASFCAGLLVLILASAAAAAEPSDPRALGQAYFRDPEEAAWRFADPKIAALALSAARGELERIDQFVAQGADPNAEAADGMTPLVWAMGGNSKAGFRRLLERGARPDYPARDRGVGYNGPTPWLAIGEAAGDAYDSQWLEMLLANGANPNVVEPKSGECDRDDRAGTTPIFDAIDSGRVENVDLLIKAGADVNHQDNRGNSPLVHAASFVRARFRIVLRLLEAGADWRIRNNEGENAAFRLAFFDDPQTDAGRDVRPVIELLEKRGADMAAARKRVAAERARLAKLNEMAVLFALKLMFVKEIRETETGVEIHFKGGCAGRLVRQSDEKYAKHLEYSREGLNNKFPVVVTMVKPDRVVAMDSADSDTVRFVKDHDAERLQVAFWKHAARYYLRYDDPDFHRVRAALEQSAKDQSLVWLSFQQEKMLVVDALPVDQHAKK